VCQRFLLANSVPAAWGEPARPELRPHLHQRISRPQHHQVLPHFRTPILYREQRLRIDSPQPRQLVGVEPVCAAEASHHSGSGEFQAACFPEPSRDENPAKRQRLQAVAAKTGAPCLVKAS
jgi:hypothetical protein